MIKHKTPHITGYKRGVYSGNRLWRAHRMEGVIKNKGIKPDRKEKRQEYLIRSLILHDYTQEEDIENQSDDVP